MKAAQQNMLITHSVCAEILISTFQCNSPIIANKKLLMKKYWTSAFGRTRLMGIRFSGFF
jgi:hypothetical protein